MRNSNREEVYEAIDSERDYQDRKWGNGATKKVHSPEEWCLYIEDYVNEAKHMLSRGADADVHPKAMEIIRKVAGMAVKCMEEHGAILRAKDAEITHYFKANA